MQRSCLCRYQGPLQAPLRLLKGRGPAQQMVSQPHLLRINQMWIPSRPCPTENSAGKGPFIYLFVYSRAVAASLIIMLDVDLAWLSKCAVRPLYDDSLGPRQSCCYSQMLPLRDTDSVGKMLLHQARAYMESITCGLSFGIQSTKISGDVPAVICPSSSNSSIMISSRVIKTMSFGAIRLMTSAMLGYVKYSSTQCTDASAVCPAGHSL